MLPKQWRKATFTSLCFGHTHLPPFLHPKLGAVGMKSHFNEWDIFLSKQTPDLEVLNRETRFTLCFNAHSGAALWLRWARDAGEPEEHIWGSAAARRCRWLPCWDGCHRTVQEEEVAPPHPGKCHVLGRWDTPLLPWSGFDAAFPKARHSKGRVSLQWTGWTLQGKAPDPLGQATEGHWGGRRTKNKLGKAKGCPWVDIKRKLL